MFQKIHAKTPARRTPPTIEELIRDSMKKKEIEQALDDFMQGRSECQGLRGKCDSQSWERIYLNGRLDEYIEVESDCIVAEVSLGTGNSPLVLLVIDSEATIKHVVTMSESVQGDFWRSDHAEQSSGLLRRFPIPEWDQLAVWHLHDSTVFNCGVHWGLRFVGTLLAPEPLPSKAVPKPIDTLTRNERLSDRSVVPYLLERGLLDSRSVVDGEISVFNVSRRNVCFRVTTSCGPHYFVKQGIGAERADSVEREAEFLAHATGLLERYLPVVRDWNQSRRILVLDLIPEARSLADHHRRIGRASVDAARQVGRAVRDLHRCHVDASSTIHEKLATQHPPGVFTIHWPNLRVFDDMSGSGLKIVKIVQAAPDLCATLDGLLQHWQPTSVIHADVKWDNVVLNPVPGGRHRFRAQIVDWEMVRLGDPLWDVGSFLSQYLDAWIAFMPATARSPQEQVRSAGIPLSTLQPATRAFWESYSTETIARPAERAAAIEMLMKYVAARLIQFAVEAEQKSAVLSATSVLRLQVAQNITQRPLAAATSLLGLTV